MKNPLCVAGGKQYNEQLLYFTSSSLSADDRYLFTISDQTGDFNIFVTDLLTGEQKQMTNNKDGYLKSYVYFDGKDHKGFGRASVSLDCKNKMIYYIQGNDICSADMDGNIRVIAHVPEDQVTAFTHVSDDGTRLCVPTTDNRALEYKVEDVNKYNVGYDIDKRVQDENLSSYLRVYDTLTGEMTLCERVNKAWITHVQFNPIDNNLIMYNHEWTSFDRGIRRMWLFNGKDHIRLRTENEERSRKDGCVHEMWSSCGKYLIYHGSHQNGYPTIGRISIDTLDTIEIEIPQYSTKYGHYTISKDGLLVSDGYYSDENDSDKKGKFGEYISIQYIDWEKRTIKWVPICKHSSSWKFQDEHPHPIFNHRGDKIYFTSDRSGKRGVYEAEVPAFLINES